jgi:hypothetical protein
MVVELIGAGSVFSCPGSRTLLGGEVAAADDIGEKSQRLGDSHQSPSNRCTHATMSHQLIDFLITTFCLLVSITFAWLGPTRPPSLPSRTATSSLSGFAASSSLAQPCLLLEPPLLVLDSVE